MANGERPEEPQLTELTTMRAQVRIAIDILMQVDASLRSRPEVGRMVLRPSRYVEMADQLAENLRAIAGLSDNLGKIMNEKIDEINQNGGVES